MIGIPDMELKRFPVENVSWNDCQEFIRRINTKLKEDGWVYRLPIEAEWEYACRGGPLKQREDFGFDFYVARPSNYLLPVDANFGQILRRPCKVGYSPPNRLGLYDMHGNVAELCQDSYEFGPRLRAAVVEGVPGFWILRQAAHRLRGCMPRHFGEVTWDCGSADSRRVGKRLTSRR